MRSMRWFVVLLFAAAISCGGGADLPRRSDVSVSITPAASTIRVGQTQDLVASATGFTDPILMWWQQDHHDATGINGSEDCDSITATTASLIANCAQGYLSNVGALQGPSSTVTYHAPMTPGTYHVTFWATQGSKTDWSAYLQIKTTATIIVMP